jgi:hypothetical protein
MNLLYGLDLSGTLVFAISGGLKAAKHELDLLGILVLSVATGVERFLCISGPCGWNLLPDDAFSG